MSDDLVKRLRVCAGDQGGWMYEEAASRIEELQAALLSIANTPVGREIPDRTTIWGLAVHMQETAKDALGEHK